MTEICKPASGLRTGTNRDPLITNRSEKIVGKNIEYCVKHIPHRGCKVTRVVKYNGKELTPAKWAEILHWSVHSIRKRLKIMPIEEALRDKYEVENNL